VSRVRTPFLTARWEHLVLLNYEVPADRLRPLVPAGTTLDLWQGQALVSLVGFLFRDTRVLGVAIPGHRDFEEVNLRFYVRRRVAGEADRRGVVFIRELVPRLAIAMVARVLYNEPYRAVPMHHEVDNDAERGGRITYRWRHAHADYEIAARVQGPAEVLEPESEAEFITEHYWGYTKQRDGGTLEYEVAHPRWRVWTARTAMFDGPAGDLYGPAFGAVLAQAPRSAFVALGSEVAVYRGRRIV
jgi:uncharacterized protein YqjF (DUF2071 family)